MTSFTTNTSDFICQNESFIQFDKNSDFGIVNLKIKKIEPIVQKRHIVFSVDCSGSMSDKCSDGRSKNDHINHTLTNMIIYFAEHPELQVSVSVFAFDGSIYTIIENETVTKNNLDVLVDCVKNIRPKDITNIQKALLNSRDYIANYCVNNIDTYVSHVFMTDGDATAGVSIPSRLKEYVSPIVSNMFIGFGIDHNAYLLKELAFDSKNNYYFVDALEKSGFVYGEIIHSIIYRVLENTFITIENGVIYDWKQNSWVTRLDVGDLLTESNKVYHVSSKTHDDCICIIKTSDCVTKEKLNFVIDSKKENSDLFKYKYRQQTQELMYEVNVYNFNKMKCFDPLKYGTDNLDYDEFSEKTKTNGKILKEKMKTLLKEMQTFLNASDIGGDDKNFIKLLCDDIFICLETFETKYSAMYSCARQTSQGAQRSYSATCTPNTPRILRDPKIKRNNYVFDIGNNVGDDDISSMFSKISHSQDDFNDTNFNKEFYNTISDSHDYNGANKYTLTDPDKNPYSTSSVLDMMHSFSASNDYDNH
jgi:hypothetical protein